LLRIRLRRVGKKKRPAYRVVVADSRAPRDGAFIENLGLYDPLTDPATININEEKARAWLQQGAQPSDTVAKLLARQGLLPPRERTASPKPPKSPKPAEAAASPAAAASPEPAEASKPPEPPEPSESPEPAASTESAEPPEPAEAPEPPEPSE
jgi:small subunit ribosomal protein S16